MPLDLREQSEYTLPENCSYNLIRKIYDFRAPATSEAVYKIHWLSNAAHEPLLQKQAEKAPGTR